MEKTKMNVAPISKFQTIKMKVPDELLKTRRTNWGFEVLKNKGDAMIIPRKEVGNAKSSAHTFASNYHFRVRSFAQQDDNGQTIMEKVFYDKNDQEVSFDDIPEEIRNDESKLAKAYTMREEPAALVVLRITDPTPEELAKREKVSQGHPRGKAPKGQMNKVRARK
jgi:hypothetical protein